MKRSAHRKPADEAPFRCGSVALVGRPNVGKSTLLNALLGQKLSITSSKPQTTRHRIQGILTGATAQFIFADTPGYQTEYRSVLNRLMNRSVRQALEEVDVIVLLVEAGRLDDRDRDLLKLIPAGAKVVMAVNKTDLTTREKILPFIDTMSKAAGFSAIVPLCARKGRGLDELLRVVEGLLPEQPAIYPSDEITDRSERFLAAELLREKIFRLLGDELPYGADVVIEKFAEEGRLRRIHASIIVSKDSHKAIIIGAGGEKMKAIASAARLDMEKLFGGKVYLEVWVKVRRGWTDDAAALKRFGYG